MNEASAEEIAGKVQAHFPQIGADVLQRCIATYQALGCWTPHVEITREAYEATLDIYEYNGLVEKRYAYEQVCVVPPDDG